MKLTNLAAELLILIGDSSGTSPDEVCWVPPGGDGMSWSETLGRPLFISGARVANTLRGLQRNGLISFTHLTPYAARITEEGRLLVERWREENSWPVEVKV